MITITKKKDKLSYRQFKATDKNIERVLHGLGKAGYIWGGTEELASTDIPTTCEYIQIWGDKILSYSDTKYDCSDFTDISEGDLIEYLECGNCENLIEVEYVGGTGYQCLKYSVPYGSLVLSLKEKPLKCEKCLEGKDSDR